MEGFKPGGIEKKRLIREGGTDRYPRYEFVPDITFDESAVAEYGPKNEAQRADLIKAIIFAAGLAVFGVVKDSGHAKTSPEPQPATATTQKSFHTGGSDLDYQPDIPAVREPVKDEVPLPATFAHEVETYKALFSESQVQAIKHFADKQVRGVEQLTRQQYVQEMMQFTEWDEEKKTGVPPAVVDEFRRVMPGWCSEESKFRARPRSYRGALGIFQIMPDNWKRYGGRPGKHISLRESVAVFGKIVSAFYTYVVREIGAEKLALLQSKFPDEETFQRQLLAPLVMGAYQTGTGRIGEAVRLYLAETDTEDMPTGRDLYTAISNFAKQSKRGKYLSGYKEDSQSYVPKIYAQAELLREVTADNPKQG